MDRREARVALREAQRWHQEGVIDASALERIEAEYRPLLEGVEEDTGLASQALYGAGGALLAAAAIAFGALAEVPAHRGAWLLLAFAVLAAAMGVVLDLIMRRTGLGEALLVASLVAAPVASITAIFAYFDPTEAWLAPISPVAAILCLALVWRPTRHALVPGVATVAFFITSAATLFEMDSQEASASLWLLLGVMHLVSVLVIGRALKRPWRQPVLALSAGGVAIASAFFANVVLDHGFRSDGAVHLFVGAVQLVLLGIGLTLKEKGLVVGAAVVLALNALFFAFSMGGPLLGTLVLLATAALLLWQAGALRRYLAGT